MSKALDTVAAADFSMVRDNDNQVIEIRSAALDATDKTKVKLIVHRSLTDAKTYTVTYTAADEAKTQSSQKVTVTDGVVKEVNITPTEITVGKETLIKYQTLDANGVIVSERNVTNPEINVEVTWDALIGTMDNDTSEYILYNEGDKATFTVTYHTRKYDTTTGAEVDTIKRDFQVTAVKDASVISQYIYTAAVDRPYDWSKVTPRQTIAINDDGIDYDKRSAFFLIKDAKGNNVTDTCGYTVESSDNSIVVADGAVKDVDGVILSPVNKGSASLMIKDADGKVVYTLPITVGEKRALATFKLSASTVNIASTAAINDPETCVYPEITAKDNYGDNIAATYEVENKSTTEVAKVDVPNGTSWDVSNTLRVYGAGGTGTSGRNNFIIKATDNLGNSMSTTLAVNSIEVSGNTSFSVVFLENSLNSSGSPDTTKAKIVSTVDTTIAENLISAPTADKNLRAVIVEKKSNVVVKESASSLTVSSVKVTKGGTVIAQAVSGSAAVTSCAAINAGQMTNVTGRAITYVNADNTYFGVTASAINGTNTTKMLEPGTYTLYYEFMGNTKNKIEDRASASFTVKDTQTAVTAKVKETICDGDSIEAVLTDSKNKYVEYYYGDVKIPAGKVNTIVDKKVTYSQTTNGGHKNAYVTSVTVRVPVAGKAYTMDVKVLINKTFTTSAIWDETK